jgi:thiamine-phosphate pyrophosphorylase
MSDRCLLYYITDGGQFAGDEAARRRTLLDKIAEAARAGVDYIQLREKGLSSRELELLARDAVRAVREVRARYRESRTRLLINSRTDVALAATADGVHLRSNDITSVEVRNIWRSCSVDASAGVGAPLIGTSSHTAEDVARAASDGADFTVFAPVFGKRDYPGARPAGLAQLREACRGKIPVFALGGVTLQNAMSCLEAGASGVAGIRLFQENTISEVVRQLRSLNPWNH